MKKVMVNINNKVVYTSLLILGLVLLGGIVFATLGSIPNPGHSLNQIQKCSANEILKMNADGTDWGCSSDNSPWEVFKDNNGNPLPVSPGDLPSSKGKISYSYGRWVPANAKELLISIYFKPSNTCTYPYCLFQISTEESGAINSIQRILFSDKGTYSDNFWIPVTSNQQFSVELVIVSGDNPKPIGTVVLMGYR